MKNLNGLKICTFLSLGIHFSFLFLFTLLFPDLELNLTSPSSPPPEVFVSKVGREPQPKRISIQKTFQKQDSPSPPQPAENRAHSLPSESEPSQFPKIIEEGTPVVPLKESFNPPEENTRNMEDPITIETHLPVKKGLPAEESSVAENTIIQIENRAAKVEKVEEEKKLEKPVAQSPSSKIPLESLPETSSTKKETNLIYPRYVENPKPFYPREARKKGYEGEVLLRVEVLTNGRVGHVEVRRSSGYEILDRSAIETIKQWRFIPAQNGEERIPFWVNIPIKFQLQ